MEQTPSTGFKINFADLKVKFKEALRYLPGFLKNPLESIKRVPNWDWWTIILLEIFVGAVCSVLSGFVSRSFISVIGGLILGPIMNLVITCILSGVLYYAVLFVMKTELDFKKVFTVVVFADIPAQLLAIISPIARPITLICIIVTSLMLVVGFVENFLLDKKKMSQIMGVLGGIIILFWLYSVLIDATTATRIKVQDYTPESLDQIHKELNEGLNEK